MQLVAVSIESIRIGQPLPFSLMDKEGVLLARKGLVVPARKELEEFFARSGGLYIDVADSEVHHRAFVDQLYGLVLAEKSLGVIASTQISNETRTTQQAATDDRLNWLDLQTIANALLRDTQSASFWERLERLQRQLLRHSRSNPDGALFALIYLSAFELRMYSATHAMLVSVICILAARDVLGWSEEEQMLVGRAALTMNIGMTDLQDRLALQTEAPTPTQRQHVNNHAHYSVECLLDLGVQDAVWLQIVRDHHRAAPGPLASRTPADRLARLIRRADMFAARLSPRASRPPIAPAAAMQACYFDENQATDEAGAAIIKAVGIYQPGSFVRLPTQEVAVVIQRGRNTTTPRVAVLINRSGMPTVEPILRDTSQREYRIVASVPHRDVKIQLNLERLLPLTSLPKSDRPW